MKNLEPKRLYVNDEIGTAFIAIADLLGIDQNRLLEELIATYLKSIRGKIVHSAPKNPQFTERYPYIQ